MPGGRPQAQGRARAQAGRTGHGQALGKPARLIPVPSALLKLGAASVGKPAVAQRLCGSLQVDISRTRQLLGWSPPVSVDAGLRKAAEGYWREASV